MTSNQLNSLLIRALIASGFSLVNARSLAAQTVLAEELGQSNVGVAHLFDYIDGPADGRIDGHAIPTVTRAAPSIISVDGNRGLPQTGFDRVFDDLVSTARQQGLSLFLHRNATLCGSLSTYLVRLADAGLVSLAATNGTAFLAGSGGSRPVFCTNPMAFSAPQKDGPPLLIDQSSSATAYVNIRSAAQRGESIPPGWAIDNQGQPTTDPEAALKGALLAFGGTRGANIALMVEVLAAGLTMANWSLDAAPFAEGDTCPATGLFVLAINPTKVDSRFNSRMKDYIQRLSKKFSVYIPGVSKAEALIQSRQKGIQVNNEYIQRLEEIAAKS